MTTEDRYMERGVQTEAAQTSSAPVAAEESGAMVDTSGSADISVSSVSSLIIHTRPPTPTESLREDDVTAEEDSPPSIQTKTRNLKYPEVVYLRPATVGVQTLKSVSARVVSLPETVSKYSAKQEKTGRRVVSMPERGKSPLSSQTLPAYTDQDSFEPDTESPARARVRSVATDLPHTPSPPSSPDSIVFIANKSPLPEQFLRKKIIVNQSRTPEPQDENWSTWAKSPPRPIPALHGPLSLPYARCPSGAEGTVIEQQESLPRVIWGLDASDSTKESKDIVEEERTQTQSAPPVSPAAPSTRKQNTRQKQTSVVPPRFANQKARTETRLTEQASAPRQQLLTPDSDQYYTPLQLSATFNASGPSYPSLPARGPIDLSQLMCSRTEGANTYVQIDDFSNNAAFGSLPSGIRTYSSAGDLGLDWSTFNKAQDYLGTCLSGSIWSFPGNGSGNYSGAPGISPTFSMRSLVSSRSPIILDPPGQRLQTRLTQQSPMSSQYSTSTLNTPALSLQGGPGGPSRATSALEIAQKYRQQQLIQQKQAQSTLPTPPNSSSPIWSAGFSPYQASLLSPEVLAAAQMPNVARDINSQQSALRQQVEVLQQLRTADHARLGVSGRNAEAQISFLAPAARIQDHISDAYDLPLARDGLDPALNKGPFTNTQQLRHADPRSSVSQTRHSSTSFQPIHTVADMHRSGPPEGNFVQSHGPALPSSTSSPKVQPRGPLTQQNPRSVPLARLVQRRLSAVPEEDSSMLSDNNSRTQARPADPSVVYHRSAAAAEAQTQDKLQQATAEYVGQRQQRRKQTPGPGTQSAAHARKPASGGQQYQRQAREGAAHGGRGQDEHAAGAHRSSSVDSIVSQRTDPPQGSKRGGFRGGRGRGWRGRRANAGVHGPERVDGGLTVRS